MPKFFRFFFLIVSFILFGSRLKSEVLSVQVDGQVYSIQVPDDRPEEAIYQFWVGGQNYEVLVPASEVLQTSKSSIKNPDIEALSKQIESLLEIQKNYYKNKLDSPRSEKINFSKPAEAEKPDIKIVNSAQAVNPAQVALPGQVIDQSQGPVSLRASKPAKADLPASEVKPDEKGIEPQAQAQSDVEINVPIPKKLVAQEQIDELINGLKLNIDRLFSIKAKREKTAFINLITADETLYIRVIHAFKMVASFISARDMILLNAFYVERKMRRNKVIDEKNPEASKALEQAGPLETELNRFANFMSEFVRAAESATDQKQFRPFSPRFYDNTSAAWQALRMASDSLFYLLESEGFILIMEELGMLQDFVDACMPMFKPPFVPKFAPRAQVSDGDTNFVERYSNLIDEINLIANSVYRTMISGKEKAPMKFLNLLSTLMDPDFAFILQKRGYRERKGGDMKYYQSQFNWASIIDEGKFPNVAAYLTKDVLRDVLANSLVLLAMASCDSFLGYTFQGLQRFLVNNEIKWQVITAVRTLAESCKAKTKIIAPDKSEKVIVRDYLKDKLTAQNKAALEKTDVYVIGQNKITALVKTIKSSSGISPVEYKILSLASEAEKLLPSRFSNNIQSAPQYKQAVNKLLEIFILTNPIISDYQALVLQRKTQFYDAFQFEQVNGIAIEKVTKETCQQLVTLVVEVLNNAQGMLGLLGGLINSSRGESYRADAAKLLTAVIDNKSFMSRLDDTSRSRLDNLQVKFGVSSLALSQSMGGVSYESGVRLRGAAVQSLMPVVGNSRYMQGQSAAQESAAAQERAASASKDEALAGPVDYSQDPTS